MMSHTRSIASYPITGGVVLSGWLPLKADYPAALTEVGKSIKFFAGHGTISPLFFLRLM